MKPNQYTCPNCGANLAIDVEHLDKPMNCPFCDSPITAPTDVLNTVIAEKEETKRTAMKEETKRTEIRENAITQRKENRWKNVNTTMKTTGDTISSVSNLVKNIWLLVSVIVTAAVLIALLGFISKIMNTVETMETGTEAKREIPVQQTAEETTPKTVPKTQPGSEFQTVPKTEPKTEAKTEPKAEQKTEQKTQPKTDPGKKTDGVSPAFKKQMDAYEAFFDEYIAMLQGVADGSFEAILNYASMMGKYEALLSEMEEIEEEDLSAADAQYYLEVYTRIMNKLMNVLN